MAGTVAAHPSAMMSANVPDVTFILPPMWIAPLIARRSHYSRNTLDRFELPTHDRSSRRCTGQHAQLVCLIEHVRYSFAGSPLASVTKEINKHRRARSTRPRAERLP